MNDSPQLFLLIIAVVWLFATWLTSALGGWRSLASHYRLDGEFTGEVFRFRTARIGIGNYGGILNLGTGHEGLFMGVMFLFRAGHPPLLIPWNDISCTQKKRWYVRYAVLRFRQAPKVEMMIPMKQALELKQKAGAWGALRDLPDEPLVS